MGNRYSNLLKEMCAPRICWILSVWRSDFLEQCRTGTSLFWLSVFSFTGLHLLSMWHYACQIHSYSHIRFHHPPIQKKEVEQCLETTFWDLRRLRRSKLIAVTLQIKCVVWEFAKTSRAGAPVRKNCPKSCLFPASPDAEDGWCHKEFGRRKEVHRDLASLPASQLPLGFSLRSSELFIFFFIELVCLRHVLRVST